MKIRSQLVTVLAAGCALGIALPPCASAAVSDEEFQQLKDLVSQQGQEIKQQDQRIDQLTETHEQDQTNHLLDQQKIQQLEQQLGDTQTTATNAMEKADEVAQAQAAAVPGPAASHNFALAGDAEVIFGNVHGQHAGFAMADYAPIFLYRAGDKILFEAGFDFLIGNGDTGTSPDFNAGTAYNFDLSFATIDYLVNDYLTFEAGNMLLPLGTYSERSAGWLDKFPDNPLPRGLVPGTGIGAQLRGAIPVGGAGQMVTYSIYGVNGPSATDNSGTFGSLDLGGNTGILSNSRYGGATTFDNLGNIDGSPSGGGRVAWFYPWQAHWDVELGLSGQYGEWNNMGNNFSALVFDAAVHLSPAFELKGEYLDTWVQSTDMGTVHPAGWWMQAGYKLSGLNLDLPLINNFELIGRYDTSNDILGAPDTKSTRYSAGFVYYLSNTLLFTTTYEWLHTTGTMGSAVPNNELLCQLQYGF
jgi:hypothetical protein